MMNVKGPGRQRLSSAKTSLSMARTYSDAWLRLEHSIEYLACFILKPFSCAISSTARLCSIEQAKA